MTDTTPRLGAPLLAAAQAQKHVTHNEALLQFDAFTCCRILDRSLSAPPASPVDGDTYLVKASGSGLWAGQDGKLAYAIDGGWRFYAPFVGLSAFVVNENAMLVYNAGGWSDWASVLDFQNIAQLGVNATADSTNKLAVKSSALLFDNIGNGVQAKFNKNAGTDTASVLYQTSYSGRAEIGLCGDDDFHFKVSPDGSTWRESIRVAAANGYVGIANGSPSHLLEVGTGSGNIYVGVGPNGNPSVGTAYGAGAYVELYNGSNGITNICNPNYPIAFSAGGSERMRVNASGNIGIGTSSPSYVCHVAGTFGVAPGASVTPANNGDVVFELTSNTTLTIKAKGSDGVVRSAAIALA